MKTYPSVIQLCSMTITTIHLLHCRIHWENSFLPELAPHKRTRSFLEGSAVCEGKKVCVGEDMYHALSVVETLSLPHDFWFDALCVNQQDKAEVSNQGAIMGN